MTPKAQALQDQADAALGAGDLEGLRDLLRPLSYADMQAGEMMFLRLKEAAAERGLTVNLRTGALE